MTPSDAQRIERLINQLRKDARLFPSMESIRAAADELVRLRVDAARYQWLRDAENEGDDAWFNLVQFGVCDEMFDAYVDEAMDRPRREREALADATEDAVRRKEAATAPMRSEESK